jgi:hypothetical protein
MGWGSIISFVDDTNKKVADIQVNSTNNWEMNDARGLLPVHGGGGHRSPEHDKVDEPSIIHPAADLTAKTFFQGIWYGALVNSSVDEDEPRQMRGGGGAITKANTMDTRMTDAKNDQVQVAPSRQPSAPAQTLLAFLSLGEVHVLYPSGLAHHPGSYYLCPGQMSVEDQIYPVPGFGPLTQKQVLRCVWRPRSGTFKYVLDTIPQTVLDSPKLP